VAGWWATIVFRQAFLMIAAIDVVGQPIAVAVWSARARRTPVLWPSWLVRTDVVPITNAVSISVGAAVQLRQASLIRTLVISVSDAVPIQVRATADLAQARLLRAVVEFIANPVPVRVAWYRAAFVVGQAEFVRASIVGIGHAVPVGIGATIGHKWTGFVGAGIGRVQKAIPIPVPLARLGTTISLGCTYFAGAGIINVWRAISVPIGATE
jgi:hypothetical protein